MKYLVAFLLLVLPTYATDILLSWMNSPTPGVQYNIVYASTNQLTVSNLYSATIRTNVNLNNTQLFTNLWGSWWFSVTAVKDGLESKNPEIIVVNAPPIPLPPVPPDPPRNLQATIITTIPAR